ncbi:MAG: pyridoxal phosphate-dependent aminotransferase [Herpetosiphon sp.]
MTATSSTIDATQFFRPLSTEARLSSLAQGMTGSEILKIAGEIRRLSAAGQEICNLTVGDFSPQQFPIPAVLAEGIMQAIEQRNTNYPPSDGMPELRQAIVDLYTRALGLTYPVDSVVIVSGARPALYGAYSALVNPGETVVYPVPSWNNNHYSYLVGARAAEVPTRAEDGFLPTAASLEPFIRDARMIALNTPLNPSGTTIEAEELRAIGQLIVDENRRREAAGERALYLLYDQIYWMLTFGAARHYTPPEVLPEMAAYTIFVDGISKAFAATGVRVGWAVAPPEIAGPMRDLVSHLGAWAPKAEQVGTAHLLNQPAAIATYHQAMLPGVQQRLDQLYRGIMAMQDAGLPVDAITPQGAIYLSARFDLIGRTVDGQRLDSNDAIRRFLLAEAGFAVVPFGAFGLRDESGWMRLSVGAVSPEQIEAALVRVRRALEGKVAPA